MTGSTEGQSSSAGAKPWWIGFAVIAIGAFWLYGASQLALGSQHARVGPGLFVMMTGGGLVLLGLVLLIQIARGASFEAQEAEDADGNQPADWLAFGTALLGASVPLYAMERFGFIPTAAIVFMLITRAFGSRRPLLDLIIGAVLAGVAWYGFNKLGVDLGRPWALPKLLDLIPRFSLT